MDTYELTVALKSFLSPLVSFTESIEALDKQMMDLAQETLPRSLQELPGVGPLTALVLVHELGDVRRFRNSGAVTCYAGLVPRISQSAEKDLN